MKEGDNAVLVEPLIRCKTELLFLKSDERDPLLFLTGFKMPIIE